MTKLDWVSAWARGNHLITVTLRFLHAWAGISMCMRLVNAVMEQFFCLGHILWRCSRVALGVIVQSCLLRLR